MTITAQSNFSIPPPHVAQSTLNHVCRSIVSVLVNTAWSQYLGTFLLSEVAINLFWDLVLYYLLMAVSSECAQPLLMDDRGAEVGSSQHLSESTNMELSRYSGARQGGLLIRRRRWQTQHQMMTLNFRDIGIASVRAGVEAVCLDQFFTKCYQFA